MLEDNGPTFQTFTKETIIPEIVLQQQRAAENSQRNIHVNLSLEENTLAKLHINRTVKNIDFKIFKIDVSDKSYLDQIYTYIKNVSKCSHYKELVVDLGSKIDVDIFNKNTLYNITFKGLDFVPAHCFNSYVSSIIIEAGGLIFSNLPSTFRIPVIDTMSQLVFIEKNKLQKETLSEMIHQYGGQRYKDNCLSVDSKVNVLCMNKYPMWTKPAIFA